MRIICFFLFIIVAIILAIVTTLQYISEKVAKGSLWMIDAGWATIDYLMDKATIPKY